MKRRALAGSLLTATMATGLLLVGSASASAQNTETIPASPVFGKAKVTCHEQGAHVGVKLRNPDKAVQTYMVGIQAGDIYYDYVVTVAAHGAELIEFGGLPNNTYLLQAQNAEADVVAHTRVRAECTVTSPTATPTDTPTSTPTAPPSETPTTSPTSSTSSAATAVPSTPVPVPTAVDAGLPGQVAQDDSGRLIVGAGLLATAGIMIGLGSLLAQRRRGSHH